MIVGVSNPETGRVGVGVGEITANGLGVGVAVAQTQFALFVHDGFLQLPPEHIMLDGQLEFVVQVVPHCGTGVGVGAVVAHWQVLSVVQDGFLHTPT